MGRLPLGPGTPRGTIAVIVAEGELAVKMTEMTEQECRTFLLAGITSGLLGLALAHAKNSGMTLDEVQTLITVCWNSRVN